MKPVYLYECHLWPNAFYQSDRNLTPKELYCPRCQDSDVLIGIHTNEQMLAKHLQHLYQQGNIFLPRDSAFKICGRCSREADSSGGPSQDLIEDLWALQGDEDPIMGLKTC